jgi:hypothetical protein
MLFAQGGPVQDVNAQRNPNLAEAQKLCNQAFQEVSKAQKANKYDMKGHAANAKKLLVQAAQELSEADKIADSASPAGKHPGSGSTSSNPASGITSKIPH